MATLPPSAEDGALTRPLAWTRADWLCLAAVALGALLAVIPFLTTGIASDADMLMGVYRLFELAESWRAGALYPRIGPTFNFSYGAPLFQFYPPLASYAALPFRLIGLGWIEAVKAVFALSLLLAGTGAYTYARQLFSDRRGALAGAFAYLYAPYVLTNLYDRGAAAETLALGLLPWLVYSLHRLLDGKGDAWMWISAALVALMILAHNITALIALPPVLLYLSLLAWHEGHSARVTALALATALGLGLSAFYWVPALGETRFTQISAFMFNVSRQPVTHLIAWRDLLQEGLIPAYYGADRFRLVWWQAALGVLGVIGIAFQKPRLRFPLILIAGMCLAAVVLQLGDSRALWEALPLVGSVQFPWRLLGPASFGIALLGGSLFALPLLRGRAGWFISMTLCAGVVVAGMLRISPENSSWWKPLTSAQIGKEQLYERGTRGFSLFRDYLPAWVQADVPDLVKARPPDATADVPLGFMPDARVEAEQGNWITLRVNASEAFPLRLHRFFFPGWQAAVDNEPVPTEPSGSLGLVTAEAPAGDHEIAFRVGETPLRSAAEMISLASLGLWLVGAARSTQRRWARALLAASVVALIGLVIWAQAMQRAPRRPVPYRANFGDEIHLIGYHLDRAEIEPGEDLTFRLYWLAQQAPAADYTVFVHLLTADDTGKVAEQDSRPALGYSPTTWWEPGEVVVDEHRLHLDEAVQPGSYRLVVGLYRPETGQNLPVRSATQALPGDRVVLADVQIAGP